MSAPHLWEFLTQNEWRLAFAVAFVDMSQYGDSIDLKPFHVEGAEDTWESAIIAAVRWLALELGVKFEAIAVREEDREILANRTEPVEPGNMAYYRLLTYAKKLPVIPLALETAIRELRERAPGYNPEPFEEALAAVNRDRESAMAEADLPALAETERLVDAALGSWGVMRLQGGQFLN